MANPFEFDPEELAAEQAAAEEQKKKLMILGDVGHNLSNRQSFGNYFLGRMNPESGPNSAQKLSEQVSDPWERRKKLFDQYKSAKDANDMQKYSDPNDPLAAKQAEITAILAPDLAGKFSGLSAEDQGKMFKNPAVEAYFQSQADKAKSDRNYKNELGLMGAKTKAEEARGKDIPASQVVSIDDGNAALAQISDLDSTISANADIFGPVDGRLAGMNPYNEKGQTVNSQLKTAAQKVGTFLEGGKLTDRDVPKYEKMLPTLSDSHEVATNKLVLVKRLVANKQVSNIAALKGQRYNTQGVDKGVVVPDAPSILNGSNKPKTVMQNGHTYTLNEKTGNYE